MSSICSFELSCSGRLDTPANSHLCGHQWNMGHQYYCFCTSVICMLLLWLYSLYRSRLLLLAEICACWRILSDSWQRQPWMLSSLHISIDIKRSASGVAQRECQQQHDCMIRFEGKLLPPNRMKLSFLTPLILLDEQLNPTSWVCPMSFVIKINKI